MLPRRNNGSVKKSFLNYYFLELISQKRRLLKENE